MLLMLCFLMVTHSAVPSLSSPNASPSIHPDFLAFATRVEGSLRSGNPSLLDSRVDVDQLLQRATRDLSASQVVIDDLTRDVRQSGLKLGEQLLTPEDKSRHVRLLRVGMRQGPPRALFRLLSQSGLTYYEFELGRNGRGEVVIVDIYPYMAGELLSEALRRVFLMAVAEKGEGGTERLTKGELGVLGSMPRLRRIQRLSDAGQYQEAVEEYSRLPASVLAEKSFQLMRLKAIAHLGGAQYDEALRAFEKAFPEDPVWDLLSLDGSAARDNPTAMMRAIERLDKKVEDPYLDYFRGQVMSQREDPEAAKRYFLKVLQAEPTLYEPYLELLTIAIGESDHAQAVLLLDALEQNAGMNVMGLDVTEGPTDFLKSEEYRTWLWRRIQRARPRDKVPGTVRPEEGSKDGGSK